MCVKIVLLAGPLENGRIINLLIVAIDQKKNNKKLGTGMSMGIQRQTLEQWRTNLKNVKNSRLFQTII